MTTDGGGWTVFQRRLDKSTDFYRGWDEYKNGFGNLSGNFWLGLDKISQLTSKPTYLRIDLKDLRGVKGYAKYSRFKVGTEQTKYMLVIGGFSGNVKDSLAHHNNMPFTTKDRNNDPYKGNCAVNYKGAWWYNWCHKSNLNGMTIGTGETTAQGMSWLLWTGKHNTIKFSEMKLR